MRDARIALRRLSGSPGHTLFAITSLALGISIAAAIYAAVRTVFWAPLGIAEPARVFPLLQNGILVMPGMSVPDFEELQEQQSSFNALAASSCLMAAVVTDGLGATEQVETVTSEYFGVMGLSVRQGRLPDAVEWASRHRVAVVSERFWRNRLHEDPHAIGRPVTIAGEVFEVVGVVRGAFQGLERVVPTVAWLPMSSLPQAVVGAAASTDRRRPTVAVWGRLRPDTDIMQASREVSTIARRLDASFPLGKSAGRSWTISRNVSDIAASRRTVPIAGIMVTAAALVVLIACVNLSNLSLARGAQRLRELSVQSALGASRRRLVGEQLMESAIIAAAGSVLGWALLLVLLRTLSIELPLDEDLNLRFDPDSGIAALLVVAGCGVLAIIVAGLWPAWHTTRLDYRGEFGSGGTSTPRLSRMHRTIIAWQVCATVALSLMAALCVRTVGARTSAQGWGDAAAIAWISFKANGITQPLAMSTLDRILENLRRAPGTESAGAYSGLPGGSTHANATVGTGDVNQRRQTRAMVIGATAGSMSSVGVRFTRGGWLNERDGALGLRGAVVSDRLARTLFDTSDVIGRTIVVRNETFPIVGVSDSSKEEPGGAPVLFVPFEHAYEGRAAVVLHATDAILALRNLRTEIRNANPHLAVDVIGTGPQVLGRTFDVARKLATWSAAVAAATLLFAMAGLYGVLACIVSSRRREMGLRIAVGATPGRIASLILYEGLRPVLKGLTLGLGIGTLVPFAARALVAIDVEWINPGLLAVVAVLFVLAAVAACFGPARRASRLDPRILLQDV